MLGEENEEEKGEDKIPPEMRMEPPPQPSSKTKKTKKKKPEKTKKKKSKKSKKTKKKSKKKEHVCQMCGKKFGTERGLAIHKGKAHKKEKKKESKKKEAKKPKKKKKTQKKPGKKAKKKKGKTRKKPKKGTTLLKRGFASMVKSGVIMDVINAEQAKIAEKAGAVAVMALEKIPADVRASGGIARMADPARIKEIMDAVSIPVMAKCRIGHTAEAQILEELGVDMIDESEVLTPADTKNHVDKEEFKTPFVCGARNLGEALRRINEGAAMIRTKGEPGTGDVAEAVRHMKIMNSEIEELKELESHDLEEKAWKYRVPVKLVKKTRELGRLPVVNFAAGGIATPADASLMMQLGADGIFVGSGIFKSSQPKLMAKAIVEATNNYKDRGILLAVSEELGTAMPGIEAKSIPKEEKMQERGD